MTRPDLWPADVEGLRARLTRASARIAAVRELHYPAHNDEHRTEFCQGCKGAPGVHECGCWRDDQETPVCGHCRGWKGVGPIDYPCPTIRALDEEDA